ncbi:MAG: FixH family protein [Winogradskyella sp.]|uniref:FixH family protein n=1 Tax=Winogradskyella sp. TaxID=1883156 RepID=UPI00184181D0|nr:FixH family protein [Winogradskyella sp.]MBT8243786.1 FixH family protein [Winogradskyella sp.]NNK22022.1 FixH family protein [Winogradskyella sp.]
MKINWGTAIVIAFAGFISFIMYFVISMSTNKKFDHDLVTEDYYQQELKYQEDINKVKNSKKLSENISWSKTDQGVLLSFPEDLNINDIKGKVFLYRPSNKQLDFEITISLSNHNLLIPDNRLLDGRWNIKVDWSYKTDKFMYKKGFNY